MIINCHVINVDFCVVTSRFPNSKCERSLTIDCNIKLGTKYEKLWNWNFTNDSTQLYHGDPSQF